MTEPSVYSPDTDDVITFPVEAPPNAILRDDLTALQFLQYVRLVQKHWVQTGRRHELYSPNLHHNVSNTVTVKDDEWDAVCKFIWENREYFTGISMLQYKGDKLYNQAPREAVVTEEDIAKWNKLKYNPVDYTMLREHTDETALKDVIACAGGVCELSF
jgi:ribonucleoside-diphosphate reductase alpha chain